MQRFESCRPSQRVWTLRVNKRMSLKTARYPFPPRFVPGRAKLAMSPVPIGSGTLTKTIGMRRLSGSFEKKGRCVGTYRQRLKSREDVESLARRAAPCYPDLAVLLLILSRTTHRQAAAVRH